MFTDSVLNVKINQSNFIYKAFFIHDDVTQRFTSNPLYHAEQLKIHTFIIINTQQNKERVEFKAKLKC